MCPTLMEKDYVICGLWPGYKPIKGSLVVVAHPQLQTIVKRVESMDHLGRLLLSGDHDSSISAADMGWVDKQHLIGRVLFRVIA